MVVSEDQLSAFDVDRISPEALLFQAGHLTIGGHVTSRGLRRYRLVCPNREVRLSLTASLVDYLTGYDPRGEAHRDSLEKVLV